jgi:hypothetical protein
MTMKLIISLLIATFYNVQSFTMIPAASSRTTVVQWKMTPNENPSNKDAIEVVEEYRDNLSNSRTAPGHHDGQEKKVKQQPKL